ncbi:unnamed protein product [Pedinophyceae sp. YPF-701]|nr:unnamed protein product [Pedinophyceae sp. YPF-701]
MGIYYYLWNKKRDPPPGDQGGEDSEHASRWPTVDPAFIRHHDGTTAWEPQFPDTLPKTSLGQMWVGIQALTFTLFNVVNGWRLNDLLFGVRYYFARKSGADTIRDLASHGAEVPAQLCFPPGLDASAVHRAPTADAGSPPDGVGGCGYGMETLQRMLSLAMALREADEEVILHVYAKLGVMPEDVLQRRVRAKMLHPAYWLVRDRATRLIVLVVRGTKSFSDTLTIMTGASRPFHVLKGDPREKNVELGFAHHGIVPAARLLKNAIVHKLVSALAEHPGYGLLCVGHSLGGGTAALLSSMLRDLAASDARFAPLGAVKCLSFASPAIMTQPLAEACSTFTTSVINGADMVPMFCMGSVEGLRREVAQFEWHEQWARDWTQTRVHKMLAPVRWGVKGVATTARGVGTAGRWAGIGLARAGTSIRRIGSLRRMPRAGGEGESSGAESDGDQLPPRSQAEMLAQYREDGAGPSTDEDLRVAAQAAGDAPRAPADAAAAHRRTYDRLASIGRAAYQSGAGAYSAASGLLMWPFLARKDGGDASREFTDLAATAGAGAEVAAVVSGAERPRHRPTTSLTSLPATYRGQNAPSSGRRSVTARGLPPLDRPARRSHAADASLHGVASGSNFARTPSVGLPPHRPSSVPPQALSHRASVGGWDFGNVEEHVREWEAQGASRRGSAVIAGWAAALEHDAFQRREMDASELLEAEGRGTVGELDSPREGSSPREGGAALGEEAGARARRESGGESPDSAAEPSSDGDLDQVVQDALHTRELEEQYGREHEAPWARRARLRFRRWRGRRGAGGMPDGQRPPGVVRRIGQRLFSRRKFKDSTPIAGVAEADDEGEHTSDEESEHSGGSAGADGSRRGTGSRRTSRNVGGSDSEGEGGADVRSSAEQAMFDERAFHDRFQFYPAGRIYHLMPLHVMDEERAAEAQDAPSGDREGPRRDARPSSSAATEDVSAAGTTAGTVNVDELPDSNPTYAGPEVRPRGRRWAVVRMPREAYATFRVGPGAVADHMVYRYAEALISIGREIGQAPSIVWPAILIDDAGELKRNEEVESVALAAAQRRAQQAKGLRRTAGSKADLRAASNAVSVTGTPEGSTPR